LQKTPPPTPNGYNNYWVCLGRARHPTTIIAVGLRGLARAWHGPGGPLAAFGGPRVGPSFTWTRVGSGLGPSWAGPGPCHLTPLSILVPLQGMWQCWLPSVITHLAPVPRYLLRFSGPALVSAARKLFKAMIRDMHGIYRPD